MKVYEMSKLKIRVYAEKDKPEHIIHSTIEDGTGNTFFFDGEQTNEYMALLSKLCKKPPEIMTAINENLKPKSMED